jgi:hypothetical protein
MTDSYIWRKGKKEFVSFKAITAVVMKSTIFWDMMPCSWYEFTDLLKECTASIFRVEMLAKQVTNILSVCFLLATFLAYCSTLKMK